MSWYVPGDRNPATDAKQMNMTLEDLIQYVDVRTRRDNSSYEGKVTT